MTDWIDKQKASDDQKEDAVQRQSEVRLHDAQIVRAKAPLSWRALLESLNVYTQKLRDVYPHDSSRQCTVTSSAASCTLRSQKLPFQILDLTLNLPGLCIDGLWQVQEGRVPHNHSHPSQVGTEDRISLSLDSQDEVTFLWEGRTFANPTEFAERLIKRVCRIRD